MTLLELVLLHFSREEIGKSPRLNISSQTIIFYHEKKYKKIIKSKIAQNNLASLSKNRVSNRFVQFKKNWSDWGN